MYEGADSDSFGFVDHAHSMIEHADGSIDNAGIVGHPFVPAVGGLKVGGYFGPVECYRPDGTLRWVDDAKNAICNVALDDVLNVYFRNGTPAAALYMMIVDNAGFTAFAAADTAASHTGWAESTAYTESTRVTWAPGASSGQTITNASALSFTTNANGNIRGLAISTVSTKGSSSGTLVSTAAFSGGVQAVTSGDVLKVTYTISSSST